MLAFRSVPLLALLVLGQEDDWPRWRGAGFDDRAPARGVFARPFALALRWTRALGSGYAGVVARGATVVTQGASEGSDLVFALDADTGEERWRHRIGPAFPGQDGAVDGPCSTPTLGADAAFVLGARGELLALDLSSGALRWRRDLAAEHGAVAPHWGFTTAPLLVGELVLVAAGAGEGRHLMAFGTDDGTLRWSAGTDRVSYQSPILAELAGERLVLSGGNTSLLGIDPSDGSVRFRLAHGGQDFYAEVYQPLALGDGLFLLEHQRMGAQCVRLAPTESGFALEPAWSTRHLRQNYNSALTHDGLVFGHGASFLTCVDAASGELVWRSREPGDGWTILVDGHLVVLTKAGSLHVAPAGPDGYEERARLEVLERLVWTPPSFARGRIWARDSHGTLACVEVVPSEAPRAGPESAPPASPLLAELAERLARARDPDAVLEEFWARHERLPLVEDGRRALFLFRGAAEGVVLRSDASIEGVDLPLARLGTTDLFHATLELEPDARIGYQFLRDLDEPLADPRNPRTTESLTMLGPVSQLLMPEAAPPEAALPPPGPPGREESFVVDVPVSKLHARPWGGPRRVWVRLPHGYDAGERRYPVLYVNDGESARGALGLPELCDALAVDAMEPVIAVFVELQSAYELARSEQELYRDLLVERIVPEVDARYRSVPSAEARAVLGWDEGAYAALFAALTRPECFGTAAAQSLAHGSSQGQRVLAEAIRTARKLPSVVLDWGRYDTRDPKSEADTPGSSRALAELLAERGARVRASESNDGDQCVFWRARLPSILTALFPR